MKIRLLRWLAVVLVNIGILASIELLSAWVIHKRFRKANASYRREGRWNSLSRSLPVGR
jgi:hypothetical protein